MTIHATLTQPIEELREELAAAKAAMLEAFTIWRTKIEEHNAIAAKLRAAIEPDIRASEVLAVSARSMDGAESDCD